MAYLQYLVFNQKKLPLPDSYDLDLSDVEADSGGETEAGTTQRDVVRTGVVTISVSFSVSKIWLATVYKGNVIKNLIMDCQSYTKYRPNETTGGIFVSWRRKEELPTGA